MQIELLLNGEKKIFTTPIVPMLARRKYYEVMAKGEKRDGIPTFEEQLHEDDELFSILSDIVFKGQFTLDDLYNGAETKYVQDKLTEAIFGVKKKEDVEGNEKGE